MKTLISSIDISVAEAIELELEVNYTRETGFSDGEYWRQHELNSKADQLFDADYRYRFIASGTSTDKNYKIHLSSCLFEQ